MPRFTNIKLGVHGSFSGGEEWGIAGGPVQFSAGFPLFLIKEAQKRGCDFEDLADGFGPGEGTHGDWSAIRDSTGPAIERMLERALNWLFDPAIEAEWNAIANAGNDEPID